MENALLLSFAVGFIAASPVGPIGLLCLRRTLSRGIGTGLISATGISCADAVWSFGAIHGLTTISHWMAQEQTLLKIIIGLFFFLYGLHGATHTPKTCYPALKREGGIAEFLSTFLVVFLNPSTFITFSVLFTLAGISKGHFGLIRSMEISLAVFAGSIAFWIIISQIIHRMRHRISDTIYSSISRVSSIGIMIFGAVILLCCLPNAT
jgi:threonine/homoserine/homoserine lactone efflux protein